MAKFTKDDAIKALEAKIPAKDKELDLGRTISEAVDNALELIGEDSEMELDAFVNVVFKQVKTSIGLTHSENSKVAQKLKNQIDALQKQIDDNGKHDTNDDDNGKKTDPAIQALLDKVTAMEKKWEKSEREQTVADKRKAIADKMAESIKDKEWINAYLAEITVNEDTDVEAKAKDYVAFYNKTAAGGGKRSTTPRQTGDQDTSDTDAKNALEKAKALMKQRETVMGGSPVETTKV